MNFQNIEFPESEALELKDFKAMDYYAVENYDLPIELMMENAGLQLANLIAANATINQTIKIGIGNGNNGGGGLVAARRLSAWGYQVFLDIFTDITKELPLNQLKRALKMGVVLDEIKKPDVWIDAYLGFSQRLPLDEKLNTIISNANESGAIQISLDIPTGFLGNVESHYFKSSKILTLAAPKRILYNLSTDVAVFVADLGIPKPVYEKFGLKMLPFNENNIIKLNR
jgi:NAD(P)H-hydrate epimerase